MIFLIKNKTQGFAFCQSLSSTILFSFLMLLIFSCKNEKKEDVTNNDASLKSYYYPINEWTEGMVYEYHPINNNSLPVEYWYFRKMEMDSTLILTGQYYDNTFTPRQLFNAELDESGVLMRDYFLYEYDSLGNFSTNPAEILAKNNFPFQIEDSTAQSLFKLKWKMPTKEYPDGYLEITRHRKLQGRTEYLFKNKSYDCVEFRLEELMSDFNDGHLEKEIVGKELYAKNLGLIYYRKEIDENFVLEYELRDTFSMKKFDEKFKTHLSEEK